ncbi:MAG: HEAT repeat domain-containing protein [Gemmatimonadota bacterium]
MIRTITLAVALLLAATPAVAQSLASRVEQVGTGTVRMSYAARHGVCGDGQNIRRTTSRRGEWESECEPGPVRAVVEVRGGQVIEVRTYVGGKWRGEGATDLGTVSAPSAAQYFLDLAGRGDAIKGDVLSAAVMADSADNTQPLLRLVRNPAVPKGTRRQAVFWLSQEAGDVAARGLAELVGDAAEDQDVRKQAVFALSQLDGDKSVPALIRVARTDRDPVIRKQAIFWLGQSGDPRALGLIEELLARP